jgi:hypothetical protein
MSGPLIAIAVTATAMFKSRRARSPLRGMRGRRACDALNRIVEGVSSSGEPADDLTGGRHVRRESVDELKEGGRYDR